MALFPIENPLLTKLKRTAAEADPFGATLPEGEFEARIKASEVIERQGAAPEGLGIGPLTGERTDGGVLGGAVRGAGRLALSGLKTIGGVPLPGGAVPEATQAAQAEIAKARGQDPTGVGRFGQALGPRQAVPRDSTVAGLAGATVEPALRAAEFVIEPLDVFAETAFSLVKFDKPRGYTEALANFQSRSPVIQFLLGAAFDPLIVLGVLKLPLRTATTAAIRRAARAEFNRAGIPKEFLDSATDDFINRVGTAVGNQRGGIRLPFNALPESAVAGKGFREGIAPKALPPVESLPDNFRKPLSEYTDRLFHETSIEGAGPFVARQIRTEMGDVHLSNTANLARGQRGKGVLIEFTPGSLEGQIGKKPGWEAAWKNGEGEFRATLATQKQFQDNVVSVTIEKGAQGDRSRSSVLRNALEGWGSQVNPDGSTTFTRPQIKDRLTTALGNERGGTQGRLDELGNEIVAADAELARAQAAGDDAAIMFAAGKQNKLREDLRTLQGGQGPDVVPTPDGAEDLLPPVVTNIINLKPIRVGLTRGEKLRSLAASTVGKPFKATALSDVATPAMRERARVREIIDTNSNVLGARTQAAVKQAFDPDDRGRLANLINVDTTLSGAPTIQDVAARLPRFLDHLTPEQVRVLGQLEAEIAPYRTMLDELGVKIATRGDIMEGGFYLPRGNALAEGADEVIVTSRRGGKKGFERGAVFNSMSAGIDEGFTYTPLDQAVRGFAKDAGTKGLDEHIANFFKVVRDEEGKLIGETARVRLLSQNPGLVESKKVVDKNLRRLKALSAKVSARQQTVIDGFLDDVEFDDIDALREALDGITVQRGPSAGAGVGELQTALKEAKASVRELAPAWKAALDRARATPRGEGPIDLTQLNGRTFPHDIANAANAVLASEKPITGGVAPVVAVTQALNNLYRGLNATLDNSALGIQGLLGLADDQRAYAAAFKVNFFAWGPGGDAVLGKFFLNFDDAAVKSSRLRAVEWGQEGLHIGGQSTEFMLGTEGSMLSKIPLVRQANRAFGYFSDTLRLQWADDELASLLRQGRSLDELRQAGEMRRISDAVNGATGWSPGKAGGNMGDLVLFAPRFMQARLETTARGIAGLHPGATIEQRIARRALLKLIGGGIVLTFSANWMLGQETDRRPIVDGRYNPNFMRIRFGGRDWSVFGTWDFIPRAIISTAAGKPQDVLRSSGSGIVSGAWDLISNETFVGEAVRDDPVEFAKWLLEHLTPFALEEIPFAVGQARRGEIPGAVTTILGETTGAKSAPLTGREATDIARKAQMEVQGLTGDFTDLPPAVQVGIDESKAVSGAKTAWQDQQRKRQSEFRAYADERDGINDAFQITVIGLADQLGPGRAFRETLATHQRDRARDQANLRGRNSEALEFQEELEPGAAIESQALNAYAEALFDDALENPVTLEYDFAERERRLDALRTEFSAEVITGVEAFLHRNEHPLVTELRADRETLKSYWAVQDQVLAAFPEPYRGMYHDYLNADPSQQAILRLTQGAIISAGTETVRGVRDVLRRADSAIDAALIKWEYSTSPQSVEGIETLIEAGTR